MYGLLYNVITRTFLAHFCILYDVSIDYLMVITKVSEGIWTTFVYDKGALMLIKLKKSPLSDSESCKITDLARLLFTFTTEDHCLTENPNCSSESAQIKIKNKHLRKIE